MEKTKTPLTLWIALFLLGAIWGSSFILMKIGTRGYSTIEVSSLRMFLAGAFAILFLPSILKKYDISTLFWMFISAMMGSGIPSLLYAYSASHMDSNLNGVINSLTPLFTMIVGMIWLKLKTSKISIAGICLGFLGVLILFSNKNTTFHQAQYAIFPLMAAAMYGVNMNIVKVKLGHLPAQDILLGVFGILGVLYFPFVLYFKVFSNIDFHDIYFWKISPDPGIQKAYSLIAMGILGIIGSAMASFVFYLLIKRTSALFASTNTYLIPLVSIFWGYMAGEPIGLIHFISLGIILIGVYLVSIKT